MILKILSCKFKSFTTDQGEKKDYYWCNVETAEGLVKTLGTKNDYSENIGESLEIPVEEREGKSGKWYREVYLD